jgi:hypothetical protein
LVSCSPVLLYCLLFAFCLIFRPFSYSRESLTGTADTHLHVSYIVETSLYDGATGTSDALSRMRTQWGSGTWHHPNVDLHHALLGALGGGIAYIGVLCRADYGCKNVGTES